MIVWLRAFLFTTKEKNNEISKHLEKVAKGENVEFIYSVKDKEGKTVWSRKIFITYLR